MKFTTTIFLFWFFIVFQYATQFNYLECRLVNAFSTSAVKCDCEKEVKIVAETDKNLPVSKNHVHHYVDDLFTGNVVLIIHAYNENTSSLHFSSVTNHVVSGFGKDLYRPPQA